MSGHVTELIFTVYADQQLHDGTEIPQFGLGVYEMSDQETYDSVKWALEAGYRHIDTAEWYENEKECGRALNEWLSESSATSSLVSGDDSTPSRLMTPRTVAVVRSSTRAICSCAESTGTPRDQVYLTSKLRDNRTYDRALTDLRKSLKRAQVEYFDLYLMHSAIGGPQVRKDVWRALVDAKQQGLVKSIGVRPFLAAYHGTQALGAEHCRYLTGAPNIFKSSWTTARNCPSSTRSTSIRS